MPVYASTPGFAEHRRHPKALLFIVGGHAVLVAAVMTAKMEIPILHRDPPIVIEAIPLPTPPEPKPKPPEPQTDPTPPRSSPFAPEPMLPIPVPKGPDIDTTPVPIPQPGLVVGTNPTPQPPVIAPTPAVVRTGPRFNTPEYLLRPPYPIDKQRLEEEGSLRLRLSIDERGRVIAVEPVGSVDRSFFESARKHLLAKWRYKPATEDGRPVPSSTVITLRFELERA